MNDFCYVLYKMHFIEKENIDTQDPYLRMRIYFCLWILRPTESKDELKNKVNCVFYKIKQYGSSLKGNIYLDSY